MDSESFLAWLEGYGRTWRSRNTDAFTALFSDDVRYHWTPHGDPKVGPGELGDAFRSATARQRDVDFSARLLAVGDDWCVAHWQASFDRIGTGHRVQLDGMLLAEFNRDGRCRVFREWWHSTEGDGAELGKEGGDGGDRRRQRIEPTSVDGVTLRFGDADDTSTIVGMIRDLAEYERLSHEVVADEALLQRSLFGARRVAEVLIAEDGGEPLGFALFFHNFSTFLARPGIYLEDLYVHPRARGRGVGTALLARLARLALERDCGRLEWSVLDWNEPAIGFYRRLGASSMDDWTTFRLTGSALERLAHRSDR